MNNLNEHVTDKKEISQKNPTKFEINGFDIAKWSDDLIAPVDFEKFVRLLIKSTVTDINRIDFPKHHYGPGWDGILDVENGTQYVPSGLSGWELSTFKNIIRKANVTYVKRTANVDKNQRENMVFVFVTSRQWISKSDWVREKRKKGEWKDVRAYDAYDLAQWLQHSVSTQIWLRNSIKIASMREKNNQMTNKIKVFMSYSWDGESHEEWVGKLVNRLQSDNFDVFFDKIDIVGGSDTMICMEEGIKNADKVIAVCSENYVKKSNKNIGGVGFEKMLMSYYLTKYSRENRIIPIIRNNQKEGNELCPNILKTKLYIDFRDDSEFEKNYQSLLQSLHNRVNSDLDDIDDQSTSIVGSKMVPNISTQRNNKLDNNSLQSTNPDSECNKNRNANRIDKLKTDSSTPKVVISDLPEYSSLEMLSSALWKQGKQKGATVIVGNRFSQFADFDKNPDQHPPLWNDIAQVMAKELDLSEKETQLDSLRLAEEYESFHGRIALNNLISSLVKDDKWFPGELHKILVSLPWTDIFSTNWDTLLERAVQQDVNTNFETINTISDISSVNAPRVVKLHGTVGFNDFLICTEDDFISYSRNFAPFVNLVQQAFLENQICLLGFSYDDPDFIYWMRWIREHLGEFTNEIFLVDCLNISPSKVSLLRSKNIIPVDLAELVANEEQKDRKKIAMRIFLEWLIEQSPIIPRESSSPGYNHLIMTNQLYMDPTLETKYFQDLPVSTEIVTIAKQRFIEAQTALMSGTYLSAIIMCGSVLECILLGVAQSDSEKFIQASNSPKKNGSVKPFKHWTLAQLIDTACEIGLLSKGVKAFSHGLREFRNYVHPNKQFESNFTPDEHTAKLCFDVLYSALANLARAR